MIVGGGLSGLAVAHRIVTRRRARRPVEVVVLEAKDRVGARSGRSRRWLHLEGGADSFITNKPHGVDLCQGAGPGRSIDRHRSSAPPFLCRAQGAADAGARGFVLLARTDWGRS